MHPEEGRGRKQTFSLEQKEKIKGLKKNLDN